MDPFRHWLRPLKQRIRRFKSALAGPDLHSLLNGYRSTSLLYVAVKLNLPDLLAAEPRDSADLARTLRVHGPSLHRILRGLTALGVCAEETGRFRLTSLGMRLHSDRNGSERHLAVLNGEEYAAAWNDLLHSITTGEAAFDHAFGESPWEHRRKSPGLNESFARWLENGAARTGRAMLGAYDFAAHRSIADVGGGTGALLAVILKSCPSVRGILFDQPHVIAEAQRRLNDTGISDRCEFVGGDFFERLPAGADVVILKSILHDWDDAKCVALLKNCYRSLEHGQRLLVIEKMLPRRVADEPAVVMSDIHMLAITGGRERTADEYRRLFGEAGFRLRKTIPLRTGQNLFENERL